MKPILADAGFLVALYKKREANNVRCVQIYQSLHQTLATCEPVLAEALHLLRATPGASNNLLASVEEGILEIRFQVNVSAGSVRKIMTKYPQADFADACLIRMADELDTGDILTLDSDFLHYRWRRTRSFRLLIPLE